MTKPDSMSVEEQHDADIRYKRGEPDGYTRMGYAYWLTSIPGLDAYSPLCTPELAAKWWEEQNPGVKTVKVRASRYSLSDL